MEFLTSDELRDYILNYKVETDDEMDLAAGPCYSVSWKKDHWVVKENNKKIHTITFDDVPVDFQLQKPEFCFKVLHILRTGGLEALMKFIAGFKESA